VGAIEPVASFPFVAKRGGALVLAIDAADSIYTLMADYVLSEPLGEALPELVRLVGGEPTDLREEEI
jgi:NAD-dependent deacetylase